MALHPVTAEALKEICQALGLESFARPYAVLIDQGDFGTVCTYLPLFGDEYSRLPPPLQRQVYCIDKGRYGLIGFLPKSFELPRDGLVAAVATVYSQSGALRGVSYTLDGSERVWEVLHTVRRDKLLEYAKKKKIPVKMSVRSGV